MQDDWHNSHEGQLTCRNRELEDKIRELESWKAQALEVFNDINLQEISKECGFRPGSNASREILPWIQKAKERLSTLQSSFDARNDNYDDALALRNTLAVALKCENRGVVVMEILDRQAVGADGRKVPP